MLGVRWLEFASQPRLKRPEIQLGDLVVGARVSVRKKDEYKSNKKGVAAIIVEEKMTQMCDVETL